MDFADYVSKVSFRFLQPEMKAPRGHRRLSRYLYKIGIPISLEVLNTKLAADERRMRRALRDLCIIPKMSTFAIGAAINTAVSRMRPGESFVNVGVWQGFSFLAGVASNPDKKCVGIDNFSQFGGPRDEFLARFSKYKSENHFFYDMDYQEYFAKKHEGPIGCYVYDGHHSYENQLKGLEVAEPHLAKGCIIFVDDTNGEPPRRATIDFMGKKPGAYRVILDKKTCANGHPTWWNGLMVLEKLV